MSVPMHLKVNISDAVSLALAGRCQAKSIREFFSLGDPEMPMR